MSPAAIRLALVIEFLIAIMAAFVVWGQVGGQEHLDMIPWHWKLFLAAGLAFAVVRATAAAIEHDNAWNGTTMGWLVTAVAVTIVMGALTYYYHVHEPVEEEAIETTRLL